MNNKGFTLIEALAVLVLLALVLSIGGYSVASYLNDSKEKTLDIFKENIKSGMINYYNECKHLSTIDAICKKDKGDDSGEMISVISSNTLSTTIGALVEFGFIEGQNKEDSLIIKNPVTDEEINECGVVITYDSNQKEFKDYRFTGAEKCTSLNN